jgi:hypothetical protein
MTLLGLLYLSLFHLAFDPRPDGEALSRNTAFIVSIMGILSFASIVPIKLAFD